MSESPKKKVFNVSLLGRVFLFVKPYHTLFYLSLLLAVLMAAFAPVRPYLIQLTLDKATGKAFLIPQWLKAVLFTTDLSDATKFIIAVSIFQVIFLLIETTIRFLFTFITARMGQSVVKDMRNAVYKKIISLNLSQFDKTPIGTLTTRTINDI